MLTLDSISLIRIIGIHTATANMESILIGTNLISHSLVQMSSYEGFTTYSMVLFILAHTCSELVGTGFLSLIAHGETQHNSGQINVFNMGLMAPTQEVLEFSSLILWKQK